MSCSIEIKSKLIGMMSLESDTEKEMYECQS